MKTGLIVTACALLLGGCASAPPLHFAPEGVSASAVKQRAALVATVVTVAGKSEASGRIQIAGGEDQITSLWKTALDDALGRAAIFSDDSPRRLTLAVQIRKLALPGAGVVMVTHASARYELIDRASGAVVFSRDIDSDGRVPGDFAFMGAIRMRESASRSVQNNILAFIQAVGGADLGSGAAVVANTTPMGN